MCWGKRRFSALSLIFLTRKKGLIAVIAMMDLFIIFLRKLKSRYWWSFIIVTLCAFILEHTQMLSCISGVRLLKFRESRDPPPHPKGWRSLGWQWRINQYDPVVGGRLEIEQGTGWEAPRRGTHSREDERLEWTGCGEEEVKSLAGEERETCRRAVGSSRWGRAGADDRWLSNLAGGLIWLMRQ